MTSCDRNLRCALIASGGLSIDTCDRSSAPERETGDGVAGSNHRDRVDAPVISESSPIRMLALLAVTAAGYPRAPIIIGAFGGLNGMLAVEFALQHRSFRFDLSSALQVLVVRAALNEIPRSPSVRFEHSLR